MKIRTFLLAMMICALCAVQASALEYSYGGADDFLFARPTSDDTIYEEENPNVDRSKNVALVAPGFGTPTSYLPGSGEHLTPNLVPGALSGGLVNQVGGAGYSVSENGVTSSGFLPSTSITSSGSAASGSTTPPSQFSYTTTPTESATVSFTDVTEDSYYSNGSLGTLKIPAIDLSSRSCRAPAARPWPKAWAISKKPASGLEMLALRLTTGEPTATSAKSIPWRLAMRLR